MYVAPLCFNMYNIHMHMHMYVACRNSCINPLLYLQSIFGHNLFPRARYLGSGEALEASSCLHKLLFFCGRDFAFEPELDGPSVGQGDLDESHRTPGVLFN